MIFRWQSPFWFAAELFRALRARLFGYALLAPAAVEEARLEKCNSCQFLDRESSQCTICTCWTPAKAMVAVAKCPKDKWGPVFVRNS